MLKLLLLVAVLLIVSSQPAFGQFLDPDRCLTCRDKRDHAALGMAVYTGRLNLSELAGLTRDAS